jgi:antitoxin component HigA of HigAB toxin-antitoxin module
MASSTCSVKPVKRSVGRSATAAAAYRSGAKIEDQRTGEVHDYTRKSGVVSATVLAPADAPAWAHDRDALWNAAEASENRRNSQVAREFLVGLPHELNHTQRQALALDFAQHLVDRYGFAADVCIHRPDKDGDQRNHHAHILATTRKMGSEGLTEKTRELDDRITGPLEVRWVRQCFQDVTNDHLERASVSNVIDIRSYRAQGIDREAGQHMGPAVAAMERRQPLSTRVGVENQEREIRNEEREHDEILIDVDEYYFEQLEVDQQLIKIEIAKTSAEASRATAAQEALRAARQASEAAAMLAAMQALKTPQEDQEATQEAKAVKQEHRQGQFLDGLQERMRPLIERTLDFMHEFGFPVSDDVLERFRKPEEPEQLTQLQKAQRDFDNENGVNLDDLDDLDDLDNDGPGMG